ncbi:sensor domain-containing diguanylate cyclase [Halomonas sp. GFAJ-1]|uniref:sensor domain-containing diguanylate cyclase n=1 Tax=Halomonas sp. GFAJ-1 TaxID=1118153 RepID=UPI00023A4203|nr:sensor domain-containing diguanylate cyclase [Halomonas sp. GFAJ-1]AVI61482.1 diguanylate cyclase [Halomonas sp. GFAJ-1]EHK60901.1 GAF domain/GGDEF domain protein [Halomonas sp. GFAJ-1]
MNNTPRLSPEDYETRRLKALADYQILDTQKDAAFDEIVEAVSLICDTPIAVVNFIDRDRQWFKSEKGLGVQETPRDISICVHALLQPGIFVVPDTTQDARFVNNPLVTGEPHLRFYAGAVLKSQDGYPLGTLCALDYEPRELTQRQRFALQALANQVMAHMELMRSHRIQEALIRELQTTRQELEALSSTDSLTGLLNRRAFDQRFQQEVAMIQRGAPSGALMLIDLDNFKHINDTYGHQSGDHVMVRFIELCRRVFRQYDVISRWGGDEFMVMLPRTSPSEATHVASRLHQQLAVTPMLTSSEAPLYCTVSVGICVVIGTSTMDTCLSMTDALLYQVKKEGRNSTAVQAEETR